MAVWTTKQIEDLNMSMEAARAVALGTTLNELINGSMSVVPSAGTTETLSAISYSIAPAVGTATATHAAVTLGAAEQTVTTAITNPDFPRIVTIKGNASGIAGDVVITGTDMVGNVISDTIALNAATEVVGVKAFKTVTSILLPAKTNASGDTVSIGRGDKYGFPVAIPSVGLVLSKTFDGSADNGTVTADATVAKSIYAIAGTANGTKILRLVFFA